MAPKTLPMPSKEEVLEAAPECESLAQIAKRFGLKPGSFRNRLHLDGSFDEVMAALKRASVERREGASGFADEVHAALKRKKRSARLTVEELADELDVSPKRVREALGELREQGYRIPDEEDEPDGSVHLERVAPTKTTISKSLLKGDDIRVGLVSDTHLCSNEQALDHLNLAYDHFEAEGITEVWHPGDLVTGVGIYRGQHSEIFAHTFEDQIAYAEEHYPKRDGITTRTITGNHDLEGDFGRVGANPVAAVANRREDIEFVGDYSAWIELPNGAYAHLLHGKGGMSYAYSYKAQKLVEGYGAGRKPAILCPGHWHVHGWFQIRGVQVVFPGCFEWRSKFMERLGLQPAVGFWILNIRLGEDGSVVRMKPEWTPFWEGRSA